MGLNSQTSSRRSEYPVVIIGQLSPPYVNLFVKIEALTRWARCKGPAGARVIEARSAAEAASPGPPQTVHRSSSVNTGSDSRWYARRSASLWGDHGRSVHVERRKLMPFSVRQCG